jgi:hypothetical protein
MSGNRPPSQVPVLDTVPILYGVGRMLPIQSAPRVSIAI